MVKRAKDDNFSKRKVRARHYETKTISFNNNVGGTINMEEFLK